MVTVLRPASARDSAEVARIWHEGWWDGHAEVVSADLLPHRGPESFSTRVPARLPDTVVAEVDGEVAGFVMLQADEAEQVYVDRRHRGTGVAGLLLGEAARLIAAAGHPEAWLAVAVGNDRARRCYAREGWQHTGDFVYPAPIPGGSVPVRCHRYQIGTG